MLTLTIQFRTRGPRRLPRPRHRERCENAGGPFNGCRGIVRTSTGRWEVRASSTTTAMFGRRLTSRSRLADTRRPIVWRRPLATGAFGVPKERLWRMGPRSGHVTDRSRARPRRHYLPKYLSKRLAQQATTGRMMTKALALSSGAIAQGYL